MIHSVIMIGTIVGTFLMISLTRKVKRNFLFSCVVHSIFLSMLGLSPYLPAQASQTFILVCMFVVGVAKASISFPQILFSNFFHPGEEKFYFNLWCATTFLGDTCGILISKFLVSTLSFEWETNLQFFSAVLCLSSLLMYFLIEDPPLESEVYETKSVCEVFLRIKQFLEPTANKLITADFALEKVLFNNIILWMPYSFQLNGLKGEDYIATLSYPIMIVVGSLCIEYSISFCESKSKYILTGMNVLACLAFFCIMVLKLTHENVGAHIILLAAAGFVMGAPYARVCSGDPAEVCEGEP